MRLYDYFVVGLVSVIMSQILLSIPAHDSIFGVVYSTLAFIGWVILWERYIVFRKIMQKQKGSNND
jgi:hypothetical protein